MGRFFENSAYMSASIILRAIVSIISLGIYFRVIGAEGFALVGIALSFIYLVSKLDLRYYLSLLKNNRESFGKKDPFETVFNTLYNSVLFGNALIFPLLVVLAMFLSLKVYQNPDYFILYIFAIFWFLVVRVNTFLKQFLRANKEEKTNFLASTTGLGFDFALTLLLLLVFEMGVLSIFIGHLCGALLQYLILNRRIRKLVTFRAIFSKPIFMKVMKKYTMQEYFANLMQGIIFDGGFFVSTLLLAPVPLGVLTIIFQLIYKLREFSSVVFLHLGAVYGSLGKNFGKMKAIMSNIIPLFLILFMISMVFLLTVGERLYISYLGDSAMGTYSAFAILLSGALLCYSFGSAELFVFIHNIKTYNRIYLAITWLFLLSFVFLAIYGLLGICISFFVAYLLRSLMYLRYATRQLGTLFDYKLFLLPLIFLVMSTISSFVSPIFSVTSGIIVLSISILLMLVLSIRRLKVMLSYLVREI